MSTPITLVGTVATTPKLMRTQTGVSMCTFRLASSERRYDRDRQEWTDGETNWFSVSTFRTLAEHAQRSFAKGERIILSGRLRIRRWEHEEKSGTNVEIEADALGHDLRWGVSQFTKIQGAGDRTEVSRAADAEHDDAPSAAPTQTGGQPGAPLWGEQAEPGREDEEARLIPEHEEMAEDGFLPAAA